MPDGTLKITKYVIFMLNQIESSARFPGRQVTSSTNHLKTSPGLEESEREEHATQRSPRPEVWGQCRYCEVHKGAPMHATCRGTGTPLSRKESGFVGLTDWPIWMQCGRLSRDGAFLSGEQASGEVSAHIGAASWGSPGQSESSVLLEN